MSFWFPFQPALKIVSVKVDTEELRAKITAQREDLSARILRLFGVQDKYVLAMDHDGFWHETTTFTSQSKVFCPLAHVSASVYVLNKPVEMLLLPFLFLPGAVGAMTQPGPGPVIGLILLVLALLLFLLFFFVRRRIIIGVVTDAGTAETLRLKAKGDQLEDLLDVVTVMEDLILGHKTGLAQESTLKTAALEKKATLPVENPPVASSPAGPRIIPCPHCATKIQVTAAHTGRNVLCPSCRGMFLVQ